MWQLAFGVVFVIVVLIFPSGLAGIVSRLWRLLWQAPLVVRASVEEFWRPSRGGRMSTLRSRRPRALADRSERCRQDHGVQLHIRIPAAGGRPGAFERTGRDRMAAASACRRRSRQNVSDHASLQRSHCPGKRGAGSSLPSRARICRCGRARKARRWDRAYEVLDMLGLAQQAK